VIPGLILLLMVTGLAAPVPVALAALGVVAAFVGWLAFLSWPVLDGKARTLRAVMLVLVVGTGVGRVYGWL
jgi:hypothetical protein